MIQHGTMRASTLQDIFGLIAKQYQISEEASMKRFYESHVGECYADDDSGLYGQSAAYVFSEFLREQEKTGADTQN